MVASAIFFFIGYLGIRAGNQTVLKIGMLVSLLLVVVALIAQIKFMGAQQFDTLDGTYADTWLLFSGYHIYHLLWAAIPGCGYNQSGVSRSLYPGAPRWCRYHRLFLVLGRADAGAVLPADGSACRPSRAIGAVTGIQKDFCLYGSLSYPCRIRFLAVCPDIAWDAGGRGPVCTWRAPDVSL